MQPGSFWEAVRVNAEAFRRETDGVPQDEIDFAKRWLKECSAKPTHPNGFWRIRPTLLDRLSSRAFCHLRNLAIDELYLERYPNLALEEPS